MGDRLGSSCAVSDTRTNTRGRCSGDCRARLDTRKGSGRFPCHRGPLHDQSALAHLLVEPRRQRWADTRQRHASQGVGSWPDKLPATEDSRHRRGSLLRIRDKRRVSRTHHQPPDAAAAVGRCRCERRLARLQGIVSSRACGFEGHSRYRAVDRDDFGNDSTDADTTSGRMEGGG